MSQPAFTENGQRLCQIRQEILPVDVPGLRKDAKLFKAFQAYAQGACISESVAFLTTTFDPRKHYPIYIQNNGSAQVHLAGKVREPMDDLAAANNWNQKDWNQKDWEKHVVAAKTAGGLV
ncbi:MAG: hypothetical protein CML66_02215 [Rhodobacteraceae bacterium]|nr:hypothetical protein [Paracoccaceae bacterium]MAY47609.1 hypothetical protein [Paracoccaceae bacterium]